jgi:hypothetical protein
MGNGEPLPFRRFYQKRRSVMIMILDCYGYRGMVLTSSLGTTLDTRSDEENKN